MIAIGYVSFWLAFDSYKELKKHKKWSELGGGGKTEKRYYVWKKYILYGRVG